MKDAPTAVHDVVQASKLLRQVGGVVRHVRHLLCAREMVEREQEIHSVLHLRDAVCGRRTWAVLYLVNGPKVGVRC
jgi:hypothetical protein